METSFHSRVNPLIEPINPDQIQLKSAPENGQCEWCQRVPERSKLKRMLWADPDDFTRPLQIRWFCRSCCRDFEGPMNRPFVDWLESIVVKEYLQLHAGSRLTVDQIEEIRYLHSIGLSSEFIADDVGCSRTSVWRVIIGSRKLEGIRSTRYKPNPQER
jgi:hypothetical protein